MDKPIILASSIIDGMTITATNTASGYDVNNITDLRTYTYWKATGSGTVYITIDCAIAKTADCVGIIGHNFASGEIEITLQYSTNNVDWTTYVSAFTPTLADGDIALFRKRTVEKEKRYWRLKMVSAAATPQLAVLVIGSRLDFERYMHGNFDPKPETVKATTARSKAGNILGSVINYHAIKIKAEWRHLTPTWIADTFLPVWNAHLSLLKPFFWVWDYTGHQNEVYFVAIPDSFSLNCPYNPTRRNLTLTMEGIKE